MPDTYFTIRMTVFLIRVGACCRDSCPWFYNSLIQSITSAFHTFLLFIMLVAAWSKNGCKHHQIFTNKKWENRLLLLVLQHLRQGHWGHWLLLQSSPLVIFSFASPAIPLPCLLAVNECVHEPAIDPFQNAVFFPIQVIALWRHHLLVSFHRFLGSRKSRIVS